LAEFKVRSSGGTPLQGKTTGRVKRSSPHPTDIKGTVAASEDNPEYLVERQDGKKLLTGLMPLKVEGIT